MKQRRFRRFLSGCFAAMMTVTAVQYLPQDALAADDAIFGETSDGFAYKITADAAIITKYNGDDKDTVTSLKVPAKVEGREVTELEGIFSGMKTLTSVELPDTITYLGWGCFSETAISEIRLPAALTGMNCAVFEGCENLKSLTIPKGFAKDGVRTGNFFGTGHRCSLWQCPAEEVILEDGIAFVPDEMCCSMPNLKKVVIPDSVTVIGRYAFDSCVSLESLTLPESVTEIEAGAFGGATALAKINIPDSVKTIGDKAFISTGLASITLPEGLEEMGCDVFAECENLKKLTLPSTVKKAQKALEFSHIEELTIADGMEMLPSYIAYLAQDLKKVNIPRSMTAFEGGCFGASGIEEFTVPKQLETASSDFGDSALKSVSFEAGLTRIPDKLFQAARSLTEINWSPDIAEIGKNAFANCDALESVEIPDTVTTVGYEAFSYCDSLKSIRIPENTCNVGNYAFQECSALEYVYVPVLPEATDGRGGYQDGFCYGLFQRCAALKTIEFAPDMRVIPGGVCIYCRALEEIKWPTAPEVIQQYAFNDCEGLKKLEIPDSVTTIESYAFQNCKGIEDLHLPTSLVSLGRESFRYLESLKYLYLPHELTESDGYWPFRDGAIETVEIADGITRIASSFTLMPKLRTVIFPDSLVEIGEHAFSNCPLLTNVKLPPNLTTLGNYAFNNDPSLTSITIPKTLTETGWATFFEDSGLTEITFEDGMEVIPSDICDSARLLQVAHIPASVKEIGDSAFCNCISLTELDMPQDEIVFSNTAFQDCDNLFDDRVDIYDADSTFAIRVVQQMGEGGLMHYTVYCDVNPRFAADYKQSALEIWTKNSNLIEPDSLPQGLYDGEKSTNHLWVDMGQPQGVVRFSTRPEADADTTVDIKYCLKKDGKYWDWYRKRVNADNKGVPRLELSSAPTAGFADGKALIELTGRGPLGETMTVFVNGEEAGTADINPYTGKISTNLEIPAYNGQVLRIYGVCGEQKTAEITVTVQEGKNRVLKVLMTHNAHTEYTIDLTDAFLNGAIPYFAFNPSHPLAFEVTLERNNCAAVMVTSTINDEQSAIPLTFDEASGTWRGEGFFDPHIFGTLDIVTLDQEPRYAMHEKDGKLYLGDQEFSLDAIDAADAQSEDDVSKLICEYSKQTTVAYDGTTLCTGYDFTDALGEDAYAVNAVTTTSFLYLDGTEVAVKDIAENPAKYGFSTSPLTVTDENGTVHSYYYLMKYEEGIPELLSHIPVMDSEPQAESLPQRRTSFRAAEDNSVPLDRRIIKFLSAQRKNAEELEKWTSLSIFIEKGLDAAEGEGEHSTAVVATTTETQNSMFKSFLRYCKETTKGLKRQAAKYSLKIFRGAMKAGNFLSNIYEFIKCSGDLEIIEEVCSNSDDPMVQNVYKPLLYVSVTSFHLLRASLMTFFASTLASILSVLGWSTVTGNLPALIVAMIVTKTIYVVLLAALVCVLGLLFLGPGLDWVWKKWGVKRINLKHEAITNGAKTNQLHDPSGIAYEFLPSNPVEGATAQVYYQDENGDEVLWDAEHYDQVNPQITDAAGWYAWDVPEGMWKVRVSKKNYTGAESDWLPVLPVQLGVDLNMTSKNAPAVKTVEQEGSSLNVRLTRHVKDETIDNDAIVLLDADGNVIPASVKAVKEEGNDTDCSLFFRVTPADACTVSQIRLASSVKSYAGTASKAADKKIGPFTLEKPEETGLFGDVDGSGMVDLIDANQACLYYNLVEVIMVDEEDYNLTPEQAKIADVDLNGKVDTKDSTYIMYYYNYVYVVEVDDITWYDIIGVEGVPGSPE